jgi:transcription elongation factor GreB
VSDQPNYITAAGLAALQVRYQALMADERPKLVEVVSWAAGNGDRSENGDYLYGKKRLREIDRELGWLSKRMKAARVINPLEQPDKERVWFGATVTLADADNNARIVTLLGDDEQDATAGRIGWNAPIARALRGAAIGDFRTVILPGGEREYEVISIVYCLSATAC